MVALGLLEAVLVSFVPAAAVVVVVAALALLVSSLAFGQWRATGRSVQLAVGSTVVAAVICLPWLIGVLSAGRGAVAVFGVPTPASEAASWDSLLRFAVGPIGVSPLAWGFAVAALVPLLLARGDRFRWAGRCWSIALVFWFVAWIVGRGWTGSLAIDPLVLLAPAAAALAAAIGLGIAAFEEDLRAADFGWRQLITVVAAGAVVLGSIPTVLSAIPGRWDLPVNDFSQSVTWMKARAAGGAFRVLWLGDPRSLNQGSWSAGNGLAYATSEDGSPDARWLWNAADPGPASGLASAVNLARSDRTDRLGSMLAPSGVRYVVLLTSLAPEITGEQTPQEYPVPADLAPALAHQLDLTPVVSGTGITVYANAAWIPERAQIGRDGPPRLPGDLQRARRRCSAGSSPCAPFVAGARPVLPGPAASSSYQGPLSVGTVLTASAPAGRWKLVQARWIHGGAVALVRLGREVPGDRGRGQHASLRRRAADTALAGRLHRRLAGGHRGGFTASPGTVVAAGQYRSSSAPGRPGRSAPAIRPPRFPSPRGTPVTPGRRHERARRGLDPSPPARRRARPRPVRGRATAVISVLAVVVGIAIVSAAIAVPVAAPAPGSADGVPVPPAGASSSSAFCPAGTGDAANTTVYLTNSTAHRSPVS